MSTPFFETTTPWYWSLLYLLEGSPGAILMLLSLLIALVLTGYALRGVIGVGAAILSIIILIFIGNSISEKLALGLLGVYFLAPIFTGVWAFRRGKQRLGSVIVITALLATSLFTLRSLLTPHCYNECLNQNKEIAL